jgi:hypothetical protein
VIPVEKNETGTKNTGILWNPAGITNLGWEGACPGPRMQDHSIWFDVSLKRMGGSTSSPPLLMCTLPQLKSGNRGCILLCIILHEVHVNVIGDASFFLPLNGPKIRLAVYQCTYAAYQHA